MANQLSGTGKTKVKTPSPNALTSITRPENTTDASLPRLETENMLPARATRVMPIMRIAHSSSGEVVSPRSSLKVAGTATKAIALRPKTMDPVRKTKRNLATDDELVILLLCKNCLNAEPSEVPYRCKDEHMTNKHRNNAIFFFIMAGIGLATAWYFNGLAVMRGENYIAVGFTSNVDWVYSLDLLIGGTAGMAFIVIEARRLKMRFWGLYIAAAFITAFAFVFPLFLGFRELALAKAVPAPATPTPAPAGGMKPPSVHIRALITWLAIFPLVSLGFLTIVPLMGTAHPILKVFVLTLVVVPLAVYVVVPNLMKLFAKLAAKR